jgi:hypothetical protein
MRSSSSKERGALSMATGGFSFSLFNL